MAVAVKNSAEASSRSLFDRLAVSSLVGVIYVLGSIGVIFYGLTSLWATVEAASPWLAGQGFVSTAVLIVAMVALLALLVYVGVRLVGPQPPHGLRAGIFFGLVAFLVVFLLTVWIGRLIEAMNWGGTADPAKGVPITAAVGIVLLGLAIRGLFTPTYERWLIQVEDQGWFSTTAYKRTQGQRVRRGTILGILVLAGCGIFTLLSHKTLETGPTHWQPGLPFTDRTITSWQVVGPLQRDSQDSRLVAPATKEEEERLLSREFVGADEKRVTWRKVEAGEDGRVVIGNDVLAPDRTDEIAYAYATFDSRWERDIQLRIVTADPIVVAISGGKGTEFKPGQEALRVRLNEGTNRILIQYARPKPQTTKATDEEGGTAENQPASRSAEPASFSVTVAPGRTFMLLPHVRFTVPLLLALVSLWLAWRIVNFAPFADFLIATEAEMNKVSWTTRKRLVQDTIVVLTTVVLLTVFLFFIDILWGWILSSPYIGVLRVEKSPLETVTQRLKETDAKIDETKKLLERETDPDKKKQLEATLEDQESKRKALDQERENIRRGLQQETPW
jgi:preprotein translocase SecE subunit